MGSWNCKKCDTSYRDYKYMTFPWGSSCSIHAYGGRINKGHRHRDYQKKICNDCIWNTRKCKHIWKFRWLS